MDSCLGVEQDLDKATSKFNALNDHTNEVLENIISQVEDLKNEISKRKFFKSFMYSYQPSCLQFGIQSIEFKIFYYPWFSCSKIWTFIFFSY